MPKKKKSNLIIDLRLPITEELGQASHISINNLVGSGYSGEIHYNPKSELIIWLFLKHNL